MPANNSKIAATLAKHQKKQKTFVGIFPSNVWGIIIRHLDPPSKVAVEEGTWTPEE